MLLQMFHNTFIGMGVTWLITVGEGGKIDHGFRSQVGKGGKTGLNTNLHTVHKTTQQLLRTSATTPNAEHHMQ
jgi:hypothetical protein